MDAAFLLAVLLTVLTYWLTTQHDCRVEGEQNRTIHGD
jgi:hypothetical protein